MSEATGFVGLGLMGGPMASNLVRRGFSVTVWNRTREKTQRLAEAGATVASSPRELANASRVVVTMVSDDAALERVLFGEDGLMEGLTEGSVVVDMSTTTVQGMTDMQKRLEEQGAHLVDSPVFGSTEPATTGDLWAVVGADADDLERVRPQLDAMCGTVFHMGAVGMGSLMKVSGNLIVTGMLSLLAESLTMARGGGLQPEQVLEVLAVIDFASPLYDNKGAQVVADDYAPRFPLKHALKDVNLALLVGESLGLDLAAVSGVQRDFAAAAEAGYAEEDCMAVIKGISRSPRRDESPRLWGVDIE
jgi:3-hydroxyisobutyrate dehydrogenase-like beta-hydroxyacid dehydrogenase